MAVFSKLDGPLLALIPATPAWQLIQMDEKQSKAVCRFESFFFSPCRSRSSYSSSPTAPPHFLFMLSFQPRDCIVEHLPISKIIRTASNRRARPAARRESPNSARSRAQIGTLSICTSTSLPEMPAADSLDKSGYYGHLDETQQSALDDLKKRLKDKHGIAQMASPIDPRFKQKDYADPDKCYELELLCATLNTLVSEYCDNVR